MKDLKSLVIIGTLLLSTTVASAQIGNTTLGAGAGTSITSGDYDTLIGQSAGTALTSGLNNTFLGYQAGFAQTTASDNTFIGTQAGLSTITGIDNTFIGKLAGSMNNASDNTFIGTEAGLMNTTGSDNTFVGEEAGENNTTGRDNVFVGEDAGFSNSDGDDNTAVGSTAFRTNTTGWGGSAFGNEALYDNSTGIKNSGLGWAAGTDIGAGYLNTMVGAAAGANTEYGDHNTFVGAYAGGDNNRTNSLTNANRNTAVGLLAGSTNRDGEDNVMIGAFADSSDYTAKDPATLLTELSTTVTIGFPTAGLSGDNSVSRIVNIGSYGFVKGDDSVGIGYRNRSNGLKGIAIGSEAQNTHSEAIVIGYGSISHGDNIAVIGNGSTVSIDPGTDNTTTLGSNSYRYSEVYSAHYKVWADKTSPATMEFYADQGNDVNDLWQIRADDSGAFSIASFATSAWVDIISAANNGDVTVAGDLSVNSDGRLKEDVELIRNPLGLLEQVVGRTYKWKPETGRDDRTHYGLIAQEVESAVPELVSTAEKNGIKSVNYQGFVPILISAIGELREQSQVQQEEIILLREQLAFQREMINNLTAR